MRLKIDHSSVMFLIKCLHCICISFLSDVRQIKKVSSMKISGFQALIPNLDMIASPDSFFGSQKKEFPNYNKNGFYGRSKGNFLYVYLIEHENQSRYGIVAATNIKDIQEGKVLKHENTLAEKEQQMLHLILQRKAMIKPVLLAHDQNSELTNIYKKVALSEPCALDIYFEKEKARHKLFKIKNEATIQQIIQCFESFDNVYVADGHHRISTSLTLHKNKKQNQFKADELLTVYFGFDQLTIYDYNRVVSILKEKTPTQLIAKLSKYFNVKVLSKAKKPERKHDICFMINDEAYMLSWKPKYIKEYKATNEVVLDAELLDIFVFGEILKIEDVRQDSRLKYVSGVEGVAGVRKLILKDDYAVGFMLYPVKKSELRRVADAGLTLPPKSTWFEPRIKNGVISKEL